MRTMYYYDFREIVQKKRGGGGKSKFYQVKRILLLSRQWAHGGLIVALKRSRRFS